RKLRDQTFSEEPNSQSMDELCRHILCHYSSHDYIDGLIRCAGPDAISALERLLIDRSLDHRLRLRAARALGKMGDRGSVEVLIKAIEDDYPSVRHEAISALGCLGGEQAIRAIIALLDSESFHLRRIAASAVIQAGGMHMHGPEPYNERLDLLAKLLISGQEEVMEAMIGLGDIGLERLESILKDNSFLIRRGAAMALALRIRKIMDETPRGVSIPCQLSSHGLRAWDISRLYSFRMERNDGLVTKVENTDFKALSDMLCGQGLLRFSSANSVKENVGARSIDLDALLKEYGAGELERRGRTLISPIDRGYLAVKLSIRPGCEDRLAREAEMMKFLAGLGLSSRLPVPLGGLFRIEGFDGGQYAPIYKSLQRCREAGTYAICYTADRSYFTYLNDPSLSIDDLKKGLAVCSGDLAMMARSGSIHTSLMPLFHRHDVHAGRECDARRYRWRAKVAGRLEMWRESCTYPNLRLSGLADFEHIELYDSISAGDLQILIGEHLLSLSLIIGSYFRNRGCFNISAQETMIKGCFDQYYRQLTCSELQLDGCIDWKELSYRMAQEMEEDLYMDAVSPGKLTSNGPHLGMPNGPFPIPELMRAIHIATLFMVLDLGLDLKGQISLS
ncbi:MAG TPA: HEAT repeat domain-containing protein, partial [Methanotrichaceae archaeon]|nr:HEAT repeat domain-containing protein [Methanotrichaceae archaeon]